MESKHNLLSEASKIVAQVLPHSYDTEKDLLGQIILNNKVIDEVLPICLLMTCSITSSTGVSGGVLLTLEARAMVKYP